MHTYTHTYIGGIYQTVLYSMYTVVYSTIVTETTLSIYIYVIHCNTPCLAAEYINSVRYVIVSVNSEFFTRVSGQ